MEATRKTMFINLKHLVIGEQKQIGIQFYPNKVIQSLVKELPEVKWSNTYNMAYIPNRGNHVKLIFKKFKGVCWINTKQFFVNRPVNKTNQPLDLTKLRENQKKKKWRTCPEVYLQKLELKKYSYRTAKTYVSYFEKFINHFEKQKLIEIDEMDIRNYLQFLVRQNTSSSKLNLIINSIKFYYEVVMGMPNRFYAIERPRKTKTLPKVLAKEDVANMIKKTINLKHKCIISVLYGGGLRIGELQNLAIKDIDSKRMLMHIRDAKGNKDRYVQLSSKLLPDLRNYFKEYRPKEYLFEGEKGGCYSTSSISKVVKQAAKRAGIQINVHAHMLRHSFATHLLENGTNLRHIQHLMGHSSPKTTEIYTHVATTSFSDIKNPLDCLY